jgi:NADPH2:quinone reductase
MKAIVMNSAGGCETLEYVERPDPVAGPGQALVEVAVAGVNFLDTGVRQGTLGTDVSNPKILGVEGMGRVLAVGEGVEGVAPGQRVAWVYAPGSYAERISIPAMSLVKVPDAIDDRTAASVIATANSSAQQSARALVVLVAQDPRMQTGRSTLVE